MLVHRASITHRIVSVCAPAGRSAIDIYRGTCRYDITGLDTGQPIIVMLVVSSASRQGLPVDRAVTGHRGHTPRQRVGARSSPSPTRRFKLQASPSASGAN